jgi:HD-GYP domain-containing protein (c-di-GMP phosphodiesterase class II)
MTHDRPGRTAVPVRTALKDILRQRCREFDPQLVDHLIELVRQIERESGNVLSYLGQGASDQAERAVLAGSSPRNTEEPRSSA